MTNAGALKLSEEEKRDLVQNQILVSNMTAYLERYPDDSKRIFDIVLRSIAHPPSIDDFRLSPPGNDYRARLCFIVNLVGPTFWAETAKLWKADAYFIVESNHDAIAHLFKTLDFVKFLHDPNFHFFFGYEGDDILAPLQRTLRHTLYAGKLFLSQCITPNKGEKIEDRFVDYAMNFNALLRKTVEHVFFNFGNINDSVEGLRASFANMKRVRTSGGVTELTNAHLGKPVVCVGAGPSLDQELPLLAQHQDKFIIVAVDAAVKTLLQAGCRVDYAVTIERGLDPVQEKFFSNLPADLKTELISFPVVHPQILALWPGNVRFVYRNYAWYAYFEKHWPKGILESGGSAGHLAMKVALHVGASKVILVGCDVSYEKEEGREAWRSHCISSDFPEWSHYKTFEEIQGSSSFYGFFDVEGNDGLPVKTHVIYHQWAKETGNLVVSNNAVGKVISTSLKGVKIARVPYVPFSQIVTELHPLASLKASELRTMPLASALTHHELLENLEGLLQTFQTMEQALTHILANPEPKNVRLYELAWQTFFGKLHGDTFFTAWIVQNSAREFFEAESKIYNVPEGEVDDDLFSRRVWALHQLYTVLVDIATKTVQVVRDAIKTEETDHE